MPQKTKQNKTKQNKKKKKKKQQKKTKNILTWYCRPFSVFSRTEARVTPFTQRYIFGAFCTGVLIFVRQYYTQYDYNHISSKPPPK